jgi:TFIIF-interacting CTD phosphatase-like protein
LIDFELIKLLQYCKILALKKETEEYQEDVLLKSLDLGKKEGKKLLIFDMDETLVAAKFEGGVPKGFEETFSFPYDTGKIYVRLRPYVVDCLEKLADMYEIIVFTAGLQEYADHILDYIDQDNKLFKKRLYR